MWQHKSLKEMGDEAQQRLWEKESMQKQKELENDQQQEIESLQSCGVKLPTGYAETMDCLNKPKDWDVPGLIADMAEYLRQDLDVSPGQLLAALDWMTFRLRESRSLCVRVGSGVYALPKEEATEITAEAQELSKKLWGFKSRTDKAVDNQ